MSKAIGKVLIVDDEVELKNVLVETLNAQGYDATGFTSGEAALDSLRSNNFDLLLTDLMMPEMDGIGLLKASLEIDPHLICIVMTGQGTIQTAVDAMRLGAFDYVLKPFRLQVFMPVLTRAINTRRLNLENLQLRETVAIYELSQTISFTLDPQTLISKLADAALQQTDADEVSILLPTADGNELYVAAVRGASRERLLGEKVPLQQSISSWVAKERMPLLLQGEIHDERFRALWPRPEIRSAVSVPMQVANKLVGTININALNRTRPFTLGQLKALTILASTAAAALESASLYSQLKRAEENYRSIFEHAVEGIFQSTRGGRFLTMNPALARILGYESPAAAIEQITDISSQLYVDPAARKESTRMLQERGVLTNYEFEAYRKDGEKIWLSENRRIVVDDSQSETFYEGTLEDITERKQAEVQLLQSEERYRELVENARDIIYEHDLDGRYTSANKSGQQLSGYSLAETLELNIADTIAPEYLDKAREMLRLKLAGDTVTAYELEVLTKDGGRIPVEVNTRLVYRNGAPVGVQGIARNITDRKRLEEALRDSEQQLRQSQKLEAIGQLAGGVAHDFNNLLTAINGYSALALRRLGDDHPISSYLEEIRKAGDRAANLTRQLLAFGRKQLLQPLAINLNDIVGDMIKLLKRLIGEDIQLITRPGSGLKQIKADPGQLEQVIVNLVVNARDAMPRGGIVTIETANTTLDGAYARKHVDVTPGDYVMLAVSDTGVGMDHETQSHIFEPFFTTKEKDKGTGLGLSTVYGIIRQSGGNIWVYSEVGKGTTFKIYLPLIDGEVSAKAESDSAPIKRGSETVLLVEDEDMVRKLASELLVESGYIVLEANGGEEAISLGKSHTEPIDLLITDVVMPKFSGKEVAELLREVHPETKVLFMSGYTDEAIVHHGIVDSGIAFIQKPFSERALAQKIRDVLDTNGHG
ncbi:MAG TPA: PAS domain S-box protein [Pyrinomonadaceae bacterium]|jgi:PAS domain S-box-containing protein|nr:PAS domain S-box protein [Pyrinomonadaceae bacterium]